MVHYKNDFLHFMQKAFHKFTTFTKHQKTFVLVLFALTAAMLLFPVIKVVPVEWSTSSLWIWSPTLFKSFLILALSLAALYGRNINSSVKVFMVKCFGFRESEPILNFMFLWMMLAIYMPILDLVWYLPKFTSSLTLSRGLWIQLLILLVGLAISLREVRKSANKNSQKTKILNISDEDAPQRPESKRVVQHLFEEELD